MTRQEFEDLINAINKVQYYSIYQFEDDCNSLFDFQELKRVADGLNVDKHPWYEITTRVYQCGDWFLGIRGPSQLFSKKSDFEDIGVYVRAFEMKEITTVSYEEIDI